MTDPSLTDQSTTAPIENAIPSAAQNSEASVPVAAEPESGWLGPRVLALTNSVQAVPTETEQVTAPISAEPAQSMTPDDVPAVPNKEQLHRRIAGRMTELEAESEKLAGQDGNGERAQAIENALQVARSAMSGGWDKVGQMEAMQLAQWLTSTANLI